MNACQRDVMPPPPIKQSDAGAHIADLSPVQFFTHTETISDDHEKLAEKFFTSEQIAPMENRQHVFNWQSSR